MSPKNKLLVLGVILLGLSAPGSRALADGSAPAATPAALPALPPPMAVPTPGPMTDGPYAPQAVLPGGVVVPLYPPDSEYLDKDRIRQPEKYFIWSPGEIGAIVNIHNPSIEFHPGDGALNTGAAIILAAGGGHRTLNVGGEASAEVHYFSNFGISTIILRNRLRSDGYEPKIDGVNDALQAIKLVRAHAGDWKIDPRKIGIMGFSAGAELAAAATLQWADFDRRNNVPGNPLATVASRPDFAGLIYPGPSLFAHGGTPVIPRDAPPSFITCAGWGDWSHAVWADQYFSAMLADGVPNVEMHIYARGHHPGDKVGPDEPPSTVGLTDRGFIAYGTWQDRFIDWFRDLGFLGKPGVETQAAKDVAANLDRKRRSAEVNPPLGLQLVSLHKNLDADVPAGLGLVKSFGIKLVETAGTNGLTPEQFRAQVDANGLKVIGSHFQYDALAADLPKVIAETKVLGGSYIVVPWIPHKGLFTAAMASKAASDFNAWGKVIRGAGLRLGYHPHGGEFEELPEGGTGFDVLVRETDPRLVFFEMDIFWVAHAGKDPVALLKKYPTRWKMFHLKDMRSGAATGIFTGQAPITDFVPLGTGKLDIPAILAEGRRIGVEYSIIEDEGVDPPLNIPVSMRYLDSIKP